MGQCLEVAWENGFINIIKYITWTNLQSDCKFVHPKNPMNTPALRELQIIPGVGKSIAQDLLNIGITKVSDLKKKNPEKLYQQMNAYYGVKQDICLLYVMRCAVYFASHKKHEPEKLKWWNWR